MEREIILEHAKEMSKGTEIHGVPSVKYSEADYNLPHPVSFMLFSLEKGVICGQENQTEERERIEERKRGKRRKRKE